MIAHERSNDHAHKSDPPKIGPLLIYREIGVFEIFLFDETSCFTCFIVNFFGCIHSQNFNKIQKTPPPRIIHPCRLGLSTIDPKSRWDSWEGGGTRQRFRQHLHHHSITLNAVRPPSQPTALPARDYCDVADALACSSRCSSDTLARDIAAQAVRDLTNDGWANASTAYISGGLLRT